jgi:hypothetical protein
MWRKADCVRLGCSALVPTSAEMVPCAPPTGEARSEHSARAQKGHCPFAFGRCAHVAAASVSHENGAAGCTSRRQKRERQRRVRGDRAADQMRMP